MNISYNWLHTFVDGLPDPKALAAVLTSTVSHSRPVLRHFAEASRTVC